VTEALRYFAAVVRAPASDVDRVIAELGLTDHADKLVGSLSSGQHPARQTVGLFRKLADVGAALLVSSHVMDEAARLDRLLLMREGVLLADDTPDRLRERTGSLDLEQAFLLLVRETEAARP
jgi:ABC-2 type transport system ATP-binding protein